MPPCTRPWKRCANWTWYRRSAASCGWKSSNPAYVHPALWDRELVTMTTSREVPFSGDVTAWVHTELAELKSRMAIIQQAAEQSRNVASDAAETAQAARMKADVIDQYSGAIVHLQDDQRALRELIVRTQDDIHSLRQSREEFERRLQADAERVRQDRNDAAHHFGDLERQIENWREQLNGVEEH